MTFDRKRFRFERLDIQVSYHATWTFTGLKGILAESWAHGPIFGAVSELSPGQINLTPAEEEQQKLVAIAGIRQSGLLAEGSRTAKAGEIADDWLRDVYRVLKPKVTTNLRVEVFGLYPVGNPETASRRLITHYYAERLTSILPSDRPRHAAIDVFLPAANGECAQSLIIGAVGPPHRGQFFAFPDDKRDRQWWLGLRVLFAQDADGGIEEPLDELQDMVGDAEQRLHELALQVLPEVVS